MKYTKYHLLVHYLSLTTCTNCKSAEQCRNMYGVCMKVHEYVCKCDVNFLLSYLVLLCYCHSKALPIHSSCFLL